MFRADQAKTRGGDEWETSVGLRVTVPQRENAMQKAGAMKTSARQEDP